MEWKNSSIDWLALKDLKHAYPVELADYAMGNKIQDKPAFAWWVPYTLKKCQRIISNLKTKYGDQSEKYSICLPKSVKEACKIDRHNSDKFWTNAIDKEMKNVQIADRK